MCIIVHYHSTYCIILFKCWNNIPIMLCSILIAFSSCMAISTLFCYSVPLALIKCNHRNALITVQYMGSHLRQLYLKCQSVCVCEWGLCECVAVYLVTGWWWWWYRIEVALLLVFTLMLNVYRTEASAFILLVSFISHRVSQSCGG